MPKNSNLIHNSNNNSIEKKIKMSDHSMMLIHIIRAIERELYRSNQVAYSIDVVPISNYKPSARSLYKYKALTRFLECNLDEHGFRNRVLIQLPYIPYDTTDNSKRNVNETIRKKQEQVRVLLSHELGHIVYHIDEWEKNSENQNKIFEFPCRELVHKNIDVKEELFAWCFAYNILIRKSRFYKEIGQKRTPEFPFAYTSEQLQTLIFRVMDQAGICQTFKTIITEFKKILKNNGLLEISPKKTRRPQ